MDQEELYASVAGEMGEGERAGLRGAIDRGEDLDGLLASHLQRWYFNTKTARCEPFQYSGCRGNANNFRSAAECERASRACGRTLERAATQPKGAADAGEGPGRLHRATTIAIAAYSGCHETAANPCHGKRNRQTCVGFRFKTCACTLFAGTLGILGEMM